jgi:hypothetical protein
MILAEVNRWVGVVTASAGAVIVSPAGTRLLLVDSWTGFKRYGNRVRGDLARILPLLRRNATVHGGTATITVSASARGVATHTRGLSWDVHASPEERLEALRRYVLDLGMRVDEVGSGLTREVSVREGAVADLEHRLRTDMQLLRDQLDQWERQAARIDARGLPVIAVGIFLSGVPDELAKIPAGLGWLCPALGLAMAVPASIRTWREAHPSRG